MRVTATNGNRRNGIRGCRIRITLSNGKLFDQFYVPSAYGGVNYCKKHPTGKYGTRFYESMRLAAQEEAILNSEAS